MELDTSHLSPGQASALVQTLAANVDNTQITDEQFRTFVKNCMTVFTVHKLYVLSKEPYVERGEDYGPEDYERVRERAEGRNAAPGE